MNYDEIVPALMTTPDSSISATATIGHTRTSLPNAMSTTTTTTTSTRLITHPSFHAAHTPDRSRITTLSITDTRPTIHPSGSSKFSIVRPTFTQPRGTTPTLYTYLPYQTDLFQWIVTLRTYFRNHNIPDSNQPERIRIAISLLRGDAFEFLESRWPQAATIDFDVLTYYMWLSFDFIKSEGERRSFPYPDQVDPPMQAAKRPARRVRDYVHSFNNDPRYRPHGGVTKGQAINDFLHGLPQPAKNNLVGNLQLHDQHVRMSIVKSWSLRKLQEYAHELDKESNPSVAGGSSPQLSKPPNHLRSSWSDASDRPFTTSPSLSKKQFHNPFNNTWNKKTHVQSKPLAMMGAQVSTSKENSVDRLEKQMDTHQEMDRILPRRGLTGLAF